jgi:hypothetical protein
VFRRRSAKFPRTLHEVLREAWIDGSALRGVLEEVAFDSDGSSGLTSTVRPPFMECRGFRAWPALPPSAGASSQSAYAAVQAHLASLCR